MTDPARLPNVRIDTGQLSVMRFSDGMCAITCHGSGLHLKPSEAMRLAQILAELHFEQPQQ